MWWRWGDNCSSRSRICSAEPGQQQQELNLTVDRADIFDYFYTVSMILRAVTVILTLLGSLTRDDTDDPGFSSLCWKQQGVCVSPVLLSLLCQVSEQMLPISRVVPKADSRSYWQSLCLFQIRCWKTHPSIHHFSVSDLVCIHRFLVYMQTLVDNKYKTLDKLKYSRSCLQQR